jgi:hypothetical protein
MKKQVRFCLFARGLAALSLFCFLCGSSVAQTTLISPSGDGGFENGNTFAANGWTVVNGATNQWFVGNIAEPSAGNNSAYISGMSGNSYNYNILESSVVHFYRDITFPAGQTNIALTFRWKAGGESVWDWLTVWTSPTSNTPQVNIPAAGSSSWNGIPTFYPGAVVVATPPNLNFSAPTGGYQTQTICLPASLAGTTRRIVFTWTNDNSIGSQPPASVDEISLVTLAAPANQPTALTLTPATSSISGSFTAAAGAPSGYLVVRTLTNTPPSAPVNGTTYVPGSNALGGVIVSSGASTTFNATGLTPSTQYFFWIYSFNGNQCAGPIYQTASPLTGNATTTGCSISGTRSVGPSGFYPTLTAAVADIVANGAAGPIILELQSTYVSSAEPAFPVVLPAYFCAGASSTVTIRPETGATALSIIGANTGPTIDINGGSWWRIDGRPGGAGAAKELTISNTNTGGQAIRYINEGSNNIVRFCSIQGVNTSTVSGVVLFSTTTGANGNDNNAIDNCDIRDGATNPVNGVYSVATTTTLSQYNNNNAITNCNIFNYFGATSSQVGILLGGGNSDWNITGNSFYQTAARSTTGTVNAFQSSSTLNNNLNVSDNFIGGSAPNAGGAAMTYTGGAIFRGIQVIVSNLAFSNFNNNTFQNISVTSTSTSSAQSLISLLSGRVNCNNNTIGSQTTNDNIVFSLSGSAARLQAILAGTGTPEITNINGNTIGGMALLVTGAPATAPAFLPISVQGTAAGHNFTVNNNIIGSPTTANSVTSNASSPLIGISSFSNAIGQTYNNNLIANLTSTSTGASAICAGMNLQGAGTSPNITGSFTANGNTIRHLTAQGSATTPSVYGISISGTAEINAGQVVTNNTIHSISNTNASAAVSVVGIQASVPSAILSNISGNNIHSLFLSTTAATALLRGVALNAGRTTLANNLIRLGINPDSSSITTSYLIQGIFENTGVASRIYHNSIYVGGAGVNAGSGNSFAFESASTAVGRDYRNNIFVNARTNSGGTGKHYAMNIPGMAPNQSGLISDYNLLSATGTGGFTGLFNGADQSTIADWRTATGFDFNSVTGNPQFINPNGSAASVDLHISASNPTPIEAAGANAGVANDVDGQVRAGLSPVDIGADAGNFVGIDVSGPGIGYTPIANLCGVGDINLNNVNITDATGIPLSGDLRPRVYYRKGAGAWFSQAGTLVSGTAQNSVWNFTIVAADMGGLASNDTVQYYVIAQDTSATPRIASYAAGVVATDVNNVTTHPATAFTVILPIQLLGTYTVGAGGNYPTLTAAVAAYNTSCLAGPVVFSLTDTTYPSETFPITINANLFASATNTLTIRPASGNTASITGASATGSALIRLNGADWVIIDGSNSGGTDRSLTFSNTSTLTNVAVIWVSSISTSNGATNNIIRNCNIVGGSNTVSSVFGIHVSGQTISTSATGDNNDNLVLQNNNLNTAYYGIYARAANVAAGNDGLQIIGNSIGSDSAANYVLLRGMDIAYANAPLISQNTVFNMITSTLSTNIAAIELGAGVIDAQVVRNDIRNIQQTSTGGWGSFGVFLSSTVLTSGTLIANNFISGFLGSNYISGTTFHSYGIRLSGGINTRVYNNSVHFFGPVVGGASASTSANLIISSTAVTGTEIRNNIFRNTHEFAIAGSNIYNVYLVSGVTLAAGNNNAFSGVASANTNYHVGFNGANQSTLAAWQSATGQDLNSVAADPYFTSPTDLHAGNTALNGAAAPLAAVTTDIDGESRNPATPDIGADEYNRSISCPANLTVGTDNGGCAAVVNNLDAATLECPNATYAYSLQGATAGSGSGFASGLTFSKGLTVVSYTANCSNGETVGCTFTVRVNDDDPPMILCPADTVVALPAQNCNPIAVGGIDAVFSDNCPGASLTFTISGSGSGSGNGQASGFIFPQGQSTVAYQAADSVGFQASCAFVVNIQDITAPTVVCPADTLITLTTPEGCSVLFQYELEVTDNCTLFVPSTPIQFPAAFENHGSGSVFTLQGNNASQGMFFNLENNAATPLTVTGFGIRFGNPTFGAVSPPKTLQIYSALDYTGNTLNQAAWTNVGPAVVSAIPAYFATGAGPLAQATLAVPVDIPAGGARGFHIYGADVGMLFNWNSVIQAVPLTIGSFTLIPGPASYQLFNELFVGNNVLPNIQVNYGNAVLEQAVGLPSGAEFPFGVTQNCFTATDLSGNTSSCCFSVTVNGPINDAGVESVNDFYCSGPQQLTALIQNNGANAISNVTVNWSLNDTLQSPLAVTIPLDTCGNSGSSQTVTLGEVNILPGTSYVLKVWTSNPNGQTDPVPENDTIQVVFQNALNGNYTIGGANPSYATFTAAVADLANRGVCGPVIFNVRSGTYSEQINLPMIVGASATNTITFQSEAGDSTSVILQHNSTVSTQNHVVQLGGGDWFRFRKMTFKALNANFARLVHLVGNADHNTFENNRFLGVVTTNTSSDRALVFSPGGTTDNHNVFRNNYLKDGSDGIWLNGNTVTSGYEIGTVVENNRFENQYRRTINLAWQNASVIAGNRIVSNTSYSSYYAIVAFYCDGPHRIGGNIFNLNNGLGAIVVENCTATPAARGLVANNFIQVGGTLQVSGIFLLNSLYQNIYFNSVLVNSLNTSSRSFSLSNGSNIRLFNNIGFNATNGRVLFSNSASNIEASNHNNLYTQGSVLVEAGGIAYPTLNAWRTATGFEINSLSVNPQFVSQIDLHTANPLLDGNGTPFPEAPTDIDGEARNATTPDIGADEFFRDSVDAALVRFVAPTPPAAPGATPVSVLLNNNGEQTLTNLQIFLSVNNAAPEQISWSGALAGGDTVTVVLDTVQIPAGQALLLRAWSALPNGITDPKPANDTARLNTQGLFAHYSFCGCSANDNSGLGNHATLVGNPACTPGKNGQAVLLNPAAGGNNGCGQAGGQYTQLPPIGPVWQSGMSVCAWVRFDNASSFERIFDFGNGRGDLGGFPIWFGRVFSSNDLRLESWISSNASETANNGTLTATNVIVNGVYQYFCATITGDTMRIYVNGQMVAERKGHPIANVFRTDNFLGHSNWCAFDPDFRGAMDEVRVYTRGLTPTEIQALYQQSPAFASFNSPVCPGTSVQLQAQGAVSYAWSPTQFLDNPNIANPVASPPNSTTYNCAMTLLDGCVSSDSLRIEIGGPSALSGVYTIGGASPDYSGFTAAVAALSNNGVCGPVTFLVRNGTYIEQITIQAIPGVNAVNTVTFQSESGDSTAVILTFAASSSATPWTLRLLGADYCTFRKMTIEATGSSVAQGIRIVGGAQYNRFENNILRGRVASSTSTNFAVIFNDTGNNSNTVFLRNRFQNGSTGLWFEGDIQVPGYITGIVVDSNSFENQYERAAYFSFIRSAKIRANSAFSSSSIGAYIGLRILNSLDSVQILANRFFNIGANASGLRLENMNGTVSAPSLVANNFIELTGTTSRQGIFVSGGNFINIQHNTVRILNTNTESRALELTGTPNNVTVQNNILANPGGGYAIYRQNGTLVSNYNNLQSAGARTGFWAGSIAASLADWRTLSGGQDLNSLAVDPLFAAPGISRPRAIEINGAATPLPGIPRDLEGRLRSPVNPDIGANEFDPDTLDLMVLAFAAPQIPASAGLNAVKILLKNNGSSTVTAATLQLRVNNNAPLTTNWTGNLPSGDTVLVNLDSTLLLAGQTYNLYAWATLPNGMQDQFAGNDTAALLNLLPALNGVYTIGGVAPDFVNFTAAANALNTAGVTGPVTFNVRNGTYNQQITLNVIAGVDSLKRIVFQSESGDSTQVVLTFASAASGSPWTLRLNGTDYCTFRKMTIEATGSSFAQGIRIVGGAQYNRFENNILRGRVTTGTSVNFAVIFNDVGNNSNTVFLRNRFQNGSTGLWFEGDLAVPGYIAGIVVDSNSFENQFERAAYFSYIRSAKIRANNAFSSSSIGAYIGLRVLNSLDSVQILANRFFNIGANANGLRLENMNGTVSAPVLVANNFIELTGTTSRQGIFVSGGNFINIQHNTVRILNTNTESRALELTGTPNNVTVQNNILANPGGGYAIYRQSGTLVSNYNNLQSAGARTGFWSGSIAASLADWRTLSGGQDLNSLAVDPLFAAPGTYRPRAIEINGAATPLPGVPRDLEGELRSATAPDIGADEFAPDALDAAVSNFVGLTTPVAAGITPVQVTLRNNGADTLTAATLYLKVNNDAPTTTNWSGVLASGQSVVVNLPSVNLLSGQVYNLFAWSAMPNNAADMYPPNDTASRLNLIPALNGIYTIGGVTPDFANFTAAVSALNTAGVSGPVTFNVRNGIYTEQITLEQIPGVDSVKQVIFQSESGDSTGVTLRFNAGTENYTVRLNGADFITLRNMTLEGQNAFYNRVVLVENGANSVTISNCVILGVATTSANIALCLVFAQGSLPNNKLRLLNNRLLNSAYGLYYFAPSAAGSNAQGVVVSGNQFSGQYQRSLVLYYNSNVIVEKNTFSPSSAGSYSGILISDANDGPKILGNSVSVLTGGIGIIISNVSGTSGNPALVANNFILVGSGASVSTGIECNGGQQLRVLFNTVRVNGTNSASTALSMNASSTQVYSILNNNLSNIGGGRVLTIGSAVSTNHTCNYNNLYGIGPTLVFHSPVGTGNFATLADWRNTGLGLDENSISVNPLFLSPNGFRVAQFDLNGAGQPSAFVSTDIDGESRNAQTPDIGADEFTPPAADAGVSQITAPVMPFAAGSRTIEAVLKNYGSSALFSASVQWTVNGVPQASVPWTGNLAPGASLAVPLGTIDFVLGQGISVVSWASDPNLTADPLPANDTAKVLNLFPALNGPYTIGGVAPDFGTFTEAVSALQNGGVIGPVTFNVRNGTYTEQISLSPVLGAGALNTVTFQSETGDSTAVTLQFNANSTNNFTVRLNGADWIRFRKMTLQANNTTSATVINITGGADDNLVENCRLIGQPTTSSATSRAIVFSSGTQDNRNVFRNNSFQNGSYGLYYYGLSNSANYEIGTGIINNRFENQYTRSVELVYQSTPIVGNNTISSNSTAYIEAILLNACNNGVRVVANKINLNRGTGINLTSCTATTAARGLVANNFVQIGGTTQVTGLRFNSATFQNVYFNSVHINSTATTSTAFDLGSGNNLRLFNNIAYNSTGGYVLQRSNTTSVEASNFNNFLTTGTNLVNNVYNATFFTTLAAWRTATGFDLNSLSVNPLFLSATDLHTINVQLDGKGTPFAEVPTDIDGQIRSITAPDIGADEFSASPNDAGIVALDYPKKAFAAGTQPVQVTLVNNGLDTLQSVQIEWTLNGVQQPAFLWTGALRSGLSLSGVTIGNAQFQINTAYEIRSWTRLPNGQPDGDVSNDTLSVGNLWAALGGNYTLGGATPDFPTFASAVNALNQGGVVDSVFFNVRNGIYTEQITLKEVFGAGPDKAITFQSETGDSTAVQLTFDANAGANYTVQLDSADWFRFRRMTLGASNSASGTAVWLRNGATNNRFERCVFQGVSTTVSTARLLNSESSADNFTTILNNRFENGYTGIYMSGGSPNEVGLTIQDNIFNNQAWNAIYVQNETDPVVVGNIITNTTATSGIGIRIVQCNNGFTVAKNRIRLRREYGIYLENSDTQAGLSGLVANNFISVGEGAFVSVTGIFVGNSDRARLYFNSVSVNSTATNAFGLYSGDPTIGLDIKNNILSCPLGAMPIRVQNATNASSNYNNLFTTGQQFGLWQNTTVATLAEWQAASGQDANSRSINPQFVSAFDLHVTEGDLNNAGVPVVGVSDDIDGELRSALTPDIGADEFAPMTTRDLRVETLLEPNKITPFPAGTREVRAVLKNNGIDTILTATVQWRVNNVPKTPFNWVGMLYPGQRDTIVIGTHGFPVGLAHNLVAYSENPNGAPDNSPANDTAKLSDLYAGLSGTYTLGGVAPNFTNFTAAVTALLKGGVLGPVTFNVRNGTYDEALTITGIRGGSPANTVTFQAESGDSALVTLTRTGQFGGAVVRLDNTDNLVFRKMTLRRGNTDGFYLANGVTNVLFENMRFVESIASSYDYIETEGAIALDSNIRILRNRFVAGYRAVSLSGYSTSSLENGALIEGNVFDGIRNRAVYVIYQNAPVISSNTINTPSGYGIQCEYAANGLRIVGNKVTIGENNTGIRLYVCNGVPADRALVANNFVSIGGSGFVTGISSYSGSYQNLVHNSVHLYNTSTSSRALDLSDGGDNKSVLNNIFANTGGGYAYYNNFGNSVLQVSDFNNLYTTGANLSFWSNANVANLAAFRTLSGREQNSVSANPLFYSAADLHVLQVALDSAASYTADVPNDIDGQARNADYPDIGADEFDYLNDDLGITALLTPVSNCELSANAVVKVVVQNFGGLPQTGFSLAYQRDNGAPVVENIGARIVQPGDTVHYTFTQTANLSDYKVHAFTLLTALPGDLNHSNDTLRASVTNFQTPTPAANMLPADGATNINPPVSFSWLPSAGATRYDIYIWKADQPQPATPVGQDLTQISYFYNPGNLVFGAAYKWQIISKNNSCQTAGPIQQFTLRELPDLTVGSVTAPAQPFSGTSISVSWNTANNGSGSTGMSSWFDYVYLSTDPVFQPDLDTYLGGASNLTALSPGQSFAQMTQVMLPNGIQGNYYLIVRGDANSGVAESNENNNTAVAFPITVNLTPPPDLRVTSIVAPFNAFSGQAINISWTVANLGSGDMLAGNTFLDYVYLSATPALNLNTATLLGTVQRTPLAAGASETRALTATLPQAIFGDFYIHIFTDRLNNVFEFAFENNNVGISDTLTIFLTPPPDLVVRAVTAPAFVSNNQTITLQWTVENEGATIAPGSWTDRVLISRAAVYHPDSVIQLGSFSNPGNLLADSSVNRSGSVTIPINIGGPWYFYVFADANNSVFEYLSENNNSGRSPNPAEVLLADLIVPAVSAPDTAQSGEPVTLQWTVRNIGSGSLLGINRTDRIYLSQQPVLNPSLAVALGAQQYGSVLLSGQEMARTATVSLPNGIFGKFYVHVRTDEGNTVFEGVNEGNNDNFDSLYVNLSPWPDLAASQLSGLSDTVIAGTNQSISYTVANAGVAAVPGGAGWSDQIYLSSDSLFNPGPSSLLLQTVSIQQSLPAGESYNRTLSINLPVNIAPNTYYLYASTDNGNTVFEYTDEGNNILRSAPFYIKSPDPVDFELLSASSMPDTLNSGQITAAQWSVRNNGVGTSVFNLPFWEDAVFLSADSLYSPGEDLFVRGFTRNGPLNNAGVYNSNQNFTIPNGLSGNYYVFIVTDYDQRTNDPNRTDNVRLMRPAAFPTGPAKPIHIKLTPSPDLAPSAFVAPTTAVSGQPVQVRWTVVNQGPGATAVNWTDKIYLSTDFTVNAGDITIGVKNQSRVLGSGQSYSDTLDVFIPISAVGNFVLIFATDANNTLFEFNGENNNTFFSVLTTALPAPSDLVVTNTVFPAMAMVGHPVEISWTLQNQGANPAFGSMRELIYFSADSVLDISDIPLTAPLQRQISQAPGISSNKSQIALTPGLPLGDYHVVVATDVQNNIFESNEGNNVRISPGKITVTVQELPIGLLTPDTLNNNTPLYYRIEVPDSLADETLLLSLDALAAGGVNELYLSHNQVPTRSVHDFAFGSPFTPDQSILVPELLPGTYYLLAYGATATPGANNRQPVTLLAEIINFSILNVDAAQGGNTGNVTLRVDGSKFTPDMTLKLKGPALATRTAQRIIYINSTRVFATFNLAGAPLGLYDMEASKQAETALLEDCFTVVAGDAGTTSSGDGSSGFFCTIVNLGTDQNLAENIVHPQSVRPNRLVPFTIQYGNAGNVDIAIPSRFLISLNGAPLALSPADIDVNQQELYLEFREIGGPPGILRPGSFSSITVYSFSSQLLSFILRE